MGVNQNRILTGSSGKVWLNGKLLAQVKSIELKISGKFEETDFIGDYATYNVYTGWSGEGSLTMQKIDSTVLSIAAAAYKSGKMPDIKIISSVTDKDTGKTEKAAVSQVVITEFMLAKFEAKALIEEEMPLKFSDYQVLSKIA